MMPMLTLVSCRTHYEVAGFQRSRILVDNRYDAVSDTHVAEFLKPYKHMVDSVMEPVVGQSAKFMKAQRPEGLLTNLLADILVWAAKDYQEQVDFSIYNMGGVRADLPKGTITYGDVLDIAPFGVCLVISKDQNKYRLVSATVNGEPVDPLRDYRVATIDYLLGGTDKMSVFKKGRNVNSPQDSSNNTRFIIMNYFREQQKQGNIVDAEIEGRITIK